MAILLYDDVLRGNGLQMCPATLRCSPVPPDKEFA